MVSFICDHCGKCCTSLGAYIRIERQLSEQDYYCKNTITGEVFPVHVAPEFAEEVDEDFTSGAAPVPGRAAFFCAGTQQGRGRSAQFMQRGPCFAGNSGVTTW